MDVREQIEKSNRDPRWEFDKKKLFEQTDYIANICADLYKIAQVSYIFCGSCGNKDQDGQEILVEYFMTHQSYNFSLSFSDSYISSMESWVEVSAESDFPLENLPWGRFALKSWDYTHLDDFF